MEFAKWLDQTVGPPWSGLILLAMVGALSGLSAWASIRTIRHVFRLPEDPK